jgi:hypothetical protein
MELEWNFPCGIAPLCCLFYITRTSGALRTPCLDHLAKAITEEFLASHKDETE